MANQFKGWRSGRNDKLSGKEITELPYPVTEVSGAIAGSGANASYYGRSQPDQDTAGH